MRPDQKANQVGDGSGISAQGPEKASIYDSPYPPEATNERQKVTSEFRIDHEGNPRGGSAEGAGLTIWWQDGIRNPHGATLEDVMEACLQRLRFFQSSPFNCGENSDAIHHLTEAVRSLEDRTRRRRERGVEGTYTP